MQWPIVRSDAAAISSGVVVRYAEELVPGGALLGRLRVLTLDERLALARRLPDLGEVVPLVVGVGDVGDVGGPGAEPVAVGGGDPIGEPGAPVVADEVDGASMRVELAQQPVDVGVLGGASKPSGRGLPKPGRRQRHRLLADGAPDLVPDGGCFRHAVHEDDHGENLPGHGRPRPTVPTCQRRS